MEGEKQEVVISQRRITARIKRVEVVEKEVSPNENEDLDITISDFTFIVKMAEI